MFTNGLPVLLYCDHESLLKIRQLSKAMRKRVNYIVKDKIVKVRKDPNNRAKNLSRWISERGNSKKFYLNDDFKYIAYNAPEKTISFNAEVLVKQSGNLPAKKQPFKKTCHIDQIDDSFPSLYFDRIHSLDCYEAIIKIMPKHTFELVDKLILPDKECPGIKEALQRIKRVTEVSVGEFFPDLSGIDWLKTVKILKIWGTNFTSELELPNLTEMHVRHTDNFSKLKCPKLEFFSGKGHALALKEIGSFTNLKILHIDSWSYTEAHHLPKGIRHIHITECNKSLSESSSDTSSGSNEFSSHEFIEPLLRQCSKLFSFKWAEQKFDIQRFQGTNLRKIDYPYETETKEKSTVRLKYAEINSESETFFSKHPELVSKATFLYIDSYNFSWKHLPVGYKKLKFSETKIFEKGKINNRIEKLKGADILSITVEKADSVRKIMKVALSVREIRCDEELEELRKEFKGSRCEFREIDSKAEKEKKCCIF